MVRCGLVLLTCLPLIHIAIEEYHALNDDEVFIHSVYFWLNDDVTDVQRAEFINQLKSLRSIPSVQKLYVGVPAGTPRSIVDNSYDVGLTVEFKNVAGQDAYQESQKRRDVIGVLNPMISEIKAYDSIAH
jgi:hypothetical protein